MAKRSFDAIIAGASFAGLAVARQLRGDVLLVDRHEVGAVQTSACGTPLWVPRHFGVEGSVLQVHDRLELRAGGRAITYDLSRIPFCTFDFSRFTRGLLEQSRVRFLRAPVTGYRDGVVTTPAGRFSAPVIVDASGWRGVIMNRGATPDFAAGGYSFGLESPTGVDDDKLTLIVDRRVVPRGLGWIFPVGRGSLVGLGSYTGASKLGPDLRRLMRGLGASAATYHGTFFPNRPLASTGARVFAVGDAAGQCLPLTAEGIRPALFFGDLCGRIVQRITEGGVPLAQGLAEYERAVARYRRAYAVLRGAQWLAAHLPAAWFGSIAAAFRHRPLLDYWWPRYGLFGQAPPVERETALPVGTPA
jgi:flavin-dependent dehydrogenase